MDDARFRKWYNAVEDPDRSPGTAFHFSRKPFRWRGNRFIIGATEGISRDCPRRFGRRSIRRDAFFSEESNSSRQSSRPPITPIDNAAGGKMWKDSGSLPEAARPAKLLQPIHCRCAVLLLLIVKRFAAGGLVLFIINDPSLHNAR